MTKTRIRTIVARIWTRLIREKAKIVPSKKTGGKKSEIDGGWNSSSVDAVAISVAA
jgi:hypothetical protein